MGKKLDAILGRNSTRSKLKKMANLAISRIAILKNQHNVRCSQALSDVVQLLQLGYQERALSRVELVIKEQNTVDAYVMIENYCHVLKEKEVLLSYNRECPDELKEVISTLIFAASRCGELPELQEIRILLTSSFGKEFAAKAVELGNNSRVHPKIIGKLSRQQASEDNRLRKIKQIATDNGITLYLERNAPGFTTQQQGFNNAQKRHTPKDTTTKSELTGQGHGSPEDITEDKLLSESIETRNEYRDVPVGPQDAFDSGTKAIAAA